MNKFRLLFWRNYRLRKHHWIFTLLEICIPILLLYLIIAYNTVSQILSSVFSEELTPADTGTNVTGNLVKEYDPARYISTLYYMPETNFTHKLMEKFQQICDSSSPLRVQPVQNASTFNRYMLTDSSYSMAISFLNISSDGDIPDTLNYEIIFDKEWRGYVRWYYLRDAYISHHGFYGSVSDFGYQQKLFGGYQFFINKAFISMKTNSPVTQQVSFQRFPEQYKSNPFPKIFFAEFAPYFVLIVTLISSVRLILNIIEEKTNGTKELMKAAGVKEWMIWVSWFIDSFVMMIVVCTTITILLKFSFKYVELSVFPFTNHFVLGAFILLCGAANTAFSFSLSAIFNSGINSILALCVSVIVPFVMLMEEPVTCYPSLMYYSVLFPAGALFQGFQRILFFEKFGKMDEWDGFFSIETESKNISVSLAFVTIMLCIQIVFFLCLFVLCTMKTSGFFVIKKIRQFVFKGYEFVKPVLQPAPEAREICLELKDLYTSDCNSSPALKGISMNIYKGEINTLVGNKESGGTSVISILAGSNRWLSGSIIYEGEDISKNLVKLKNKIGVCLKNCSLLPYASVADHLSFFAMLKGFSKSKTQKEVDYYLKIIGLENETLCTELSAVMKRKLSLVTAFIGRPEIVLIDDLSAGIDLEFRESLRNLLQDLHENQTIILNTTDVSEAEVLSDHVTVFRDGFIAAHGTMAFLNKTFDIGCHVMITRMDNSANSDLIPLNSFFEKNIRGTFKYQNQNVITYVLPFAETCNFPRFFEDLEKKSCSLGIASWNVSYTALDQILSEKNIIKSVLHSEISSNDTNPLNEPRTGTSLFLQQVLSLYKRKLLYTIRNSRFLLYQIVVLSAIALLMLNTIDVRSTNINFKTNFSIDAFYHPRVLLQYPRNEDQAFFYETNLKYLQNQDADIAFATRSNLFKDFLFSDWARSELFKCNLLFAIGYNASEHLVLYNLFKTDSLPRAVNVYSNVLLRYLTRSGNYSINTALHPIELSVRDETCVPRDLELQFYVWWYFALIFLTMDMMWCVFDFVNKEKCCRFSGLESKSIIPHPLHCFLNCGLQSNPVIPRLLYWSLNFAFDFTILMLTVLSRVLVFSMFGDKFNFIQSYDLLYVIVILSAFFCVSGIFFTYVIGHLAASRRKWYYVPFIALNVIGGLCGVIAASEDIDNFRLSELNNRFITSNFATYNKPLLLLIPNAAYTSAFAKVIKNWLETACRTFREYDYRYKNYDPNDAFTFATSQSPYGILSELQFLCVDTFVWLGLLIVLERKYFTKFAKYLKIRLSKQELENENGDQSKGIEQQMMQPIFRDEKKDSILSVQKLRKIQINWYSLLSNGYQIDFQRRTDGPLAAVYIFRNKKKYATIEVSFTASSGECLGIVGRNKVERKSVLKALSGLDLCAEIKVLLNDMELRNTKQYLAEIACCCEDDDLLEELTGREMLTFAASIKGLYSGRIDEVLSEWIARFGLDEIQGKRCSTYSNGEKRRLCFALSLISNPKVILLEEPFKDIDSASRVIIRKQLEVCKMRGQVVIFSSDSINECKDVCDRIALMNDGKIKYIGSIQQLSERREKAYSIVIKTIKRCTMYRESFKLLKEEMSNLFYPVRCDLQEDEENYLRCQVNEADLQVSVLFERLENIKYKWDIVHDYSVTNTSLEEVVSCSNE